MTDQELFSEINKRREKLVAQIVAIATMVDQIVDPTRLVAPGAAMREIDNAKKALLEAASIIGNKKVNLHKAGVGCEKP